MGEGMSTTPNDIASPRVTDEELEAIAKHGVEGEGYRFWRRVVRDLVDARAALKKAEMTTSVVAWSLAAYERGDMESYPAGAVKVLREARDATREALGMPPKPVEADQ
jgi:hypothetical protein